MTNEKICDHDSEFGWKRSDWEEYRRESVFGKAETKNVKKAATHIVAIGGEQ